ncbi:MAG TPA: hypothetical protein VFV99_33045 [Kofleriaceae bacterium]|nr:hypothetical protein [Kofleriaceae bacterium]
MRALWILVVAGCHSADSPITLVDAAPGPVGYTLTVGWTDPQDKPPPDPKPVIFIDGVATQQLLLEYPSPADARAAEHVIELRHGDTVVYTQVSSNTSRGCLAQVPDATMVLEGWCAYANGEVRFGSDQANGTNMFCIGDGFCRPVCIPGSCAAGTHCTSIYASTNPVATHLGCAPIGTQQPDAACTLVTDASGTHDDCGSGLLCVGGTCKRLCNPYNPPLPNCTCTYLPEHAPELSVCL